MLSGSLALTVSLGFPRWCWAEAFLESGIKDACFTCCERIMVGFSVLQDDLTAGSTSMTDMIMRLAELLLLLQLSLL